MSENVSDMRCILMGVFVAFGLFVSCSFLASRDLIWYIPLGFMFADALFAAGAVWKAESEESWNHAKKRVCVCVVSLLVNAFVFAMLVQLHTYGGVA